MCQSNKFWIVSTERSLGNDFGARAPYARKYCGATMWRAVYNTLDEAKASAARWLGMKLPMGQAPPRICIVECNVVGYMTPPESPLPVYTPVEETRNA